MEMTDVIKKRVFAIFITLHAILWSFIQLLRNSISIDAMEAISWGNLVSFGTNKHPPLSGWLLAGFYNLYGQFDILVYILGQLCLLIGFIYIYKLAKFFLTDEKAFCSVMILEFCFYYNYMVYIDNFNCNIIEMALWPVVTYYFYKSVKYEKLKDWLIFGIMSGLAFLGKYQAIFLFVGMLLYLILSDRKQFKKKGMYLAVLTGMIVIIPHVIWLFKTEFFSFTYMFERIGVDTNNFSPLFAKLGHIIYPVRFVINQILAVLPCCIAYLLLALQAKNLEFNFKNIKSDSVFLMCVSVIPILTQSFVGMITGHRIAGIWGSIMVSFAGIFLFYFLPVKFNKKSFAMFAKMSYAALFVSLIAVFIFNMFQTKFFISFPYKTVMNDFNKIWNEKTHNSKLKYVAGSIKYVHYFNIYNEQHPTVILETFGYENPWIDKYDVINSGAIITVGNIDDIYKTAKEAMPLLPDNYKIIPNKYIIKVCNKFDKCVEEEFYYVIVPPAKHSYQENSFVKRKPDDIKFNKQLFINILRY